MPATAEARTTRGLGKWLLALSVLALVATGCADQQSDPTLPHESSTPTAVTQADFDPCADFPQEVLKSEGLMLTGPEDWERNGVKAHGCGYFVIENGYEVRIVRMTTTLADIEAKFPESYREQQFGSRTGAFYKLFADSGPESCVVSLEMRTGSLLFDLRNPATARTTGHIESCVLVTNLVNKVLPSIPEDA